jgi:hypothetical protein
MLLSQNIVKNNSDLRILNLEKLKSASLNAHPFEYLIASEFIRPECEDRILADFPVIEKGGSFPLSTVSPGADFAKLIDELNGPEFRSAVEDKFSISLTGRPTMFTVRGHCRSSDGKIHTDSETKIITVLLYVNPRWENEGGRLRLLCSETDIEDVAAEVSPTIGTLLIFRRCDHSYHGHLPFSGPRKVIQMNWVLDDKTVAREAKRHRVSAAMKRLWFS